jgi:hypothetical protein
LARVDDFLAYSSWNPFIRNISGEQIAGARLDVTIQPDGSKPMSFKPKLLVFEPQKELRWKGAGGDVTRVRVDERSAQGAG